MIKAVINHAKAKLFWCSLNKKIRSQLFKKIRSQLSLVQCYRVSIERDHCLRYLDVS